MREHLTLVGTGAPAALAWLRARMSGTPETGCHTTTAVSALLDPVALRTLRDYLSGLIPLFFST